MRYEKLQGGLMGLLVGDALGVPYEFYSPQNIPPYEGIEFSPPPGFQSAHYGTPPGTWSDDGAQALCLLDSLIECEKLDSNNLAQRFLNWYLNGYLAVDSRIFDVGIHTSRVLKAIHQGMPVLEAGALGHEARGNGSLMRSLPLALWHQGPDEELVADAHLQSRVTHADMYCQVCCALYCLWARRFLQEASNPWTSAVSSLRQIYTKNEHQLEILECSICPDSPPEGKGTGYVVDCLNSARMVLEEGNYEQVVKAAIALGYDTDTTACVAGGIAGIRDGINGIPERWRNQLGGQEILQPFLNILLLH
jgi:ADP-ribosyl-[dinitrogen reductase] hydrolase